MMVRDHVVELAIRLVSPAFHGGDEKTGSEVLFRRLKLWHRGKLVDVPFISGNAVRGVMRRLVFRDMLDRLGYTISSLKLYHALFSGGVLETLEESTPAIDIELRKRIRSLIPPLSLLGTAIGNQVIEGKLKVMHMLPVCKETVDYHEDWVVTRFVDNAARSCYEYLDWVFHTRRAEEKRQAKDEQAVQMLYRFEVLVPGTILYTRMVCSDCNELELSALAHMLELFKSHGQIGGKPATGYGRFRIAEARGLDGLKPDAYLRHLEEKAKEITELLRDLEARLR